MRVAFALVLAVLLLLLYLLSRMDDGGGGGRPLKFAEPIRMARHVLPIGAGACPGSRCVLSEDSLAVDGCPGPGCVLPEASLRNAPPPALAVSDGGAAADAAGSDEERRERRLRRKWVGRNRARGRGRGGRARGERRDAGQRASAPPTASGRLHPRQVRPLEAGVGTS